MPLAEPVPTAAAPFLCESAIGSAGKRIGYLGISRVYLDPHTNQPLQAIQAGELIKVQLTVSVPAAASYVIVEDKLPGGLPALNSELNASSHASCADRYAYYNPCEPHFHWQSFGYNYKEIRADRVSFFITQMVQGTYIFTYLARATQAGAFTALPAEAWAMYDLTLWGRSNSEQVSVKGWE